jgi:lipooligosaccharide transport system permease protein
MTTHTTPDTSGASLGLRHTLPNPAQAVGLLLLRNYLVYKSAWKIFLTGFLEPVLFLFSIGIGVGELIESFEFNGQSIGYAEFVAPAMLATSAMNGAIYSSTFNVFFKLKFDKLYDQMLATPLSTGDVARGEIAWGLVRGGIYSAAFILVMVAMGLISSWWAVLALPAALLVAFAFSSVGMALTTYMRTWQDFEKVTLIQLPLFLFSATFFPASALGGWSWLVEITPLYRGVVLCRELTTGAITGASLVSVGYLVVMGLLGLVVVRRRLGTLLLR